MTSIVRHLCHPFGEPEGEKRKERRERRERRDRGRQVRSVRRKRTAV